VATAQTVTAERLRERQAAAEAERRRWARDLHDQTLQGLAAIRVSLVGAQVGPESELREAVDAGVAALQVELEGLREIIHDVRPSSLDDLGLGAAIEALVARHAGAGPELHLDVDLECESRPEPVRLEAEIETELYRITQEALVNALKHAHAQRVDIVVAEFEDEVGVRVRDDGIGFAPGTPTGGVGLVGMRERVELLAGRLTITSRPDGGTTVEARVPARYRAQDPRLPAR
jgi:signal transduction histidine kinase